MPVTSPSRAGNAMERARAGILGAAAELIAEEGSGGVTMAGVARRGRVAKATVYNHFRDREDLLRAVLQEQWRALRDTCEERPVADRLQVAAAWLSASPVLAGVRRHDPQLLVSLSAAALAHERVRTDVRGWMPTAADPEPAVRWLVSFATVPASSVESTHWPADAP